MTQGLPIESTSSIEEIDIHKGIVDGYGTGKVIPFSPSTQLELEKLSSFLGILGDEVIPQFVERDGKAHLHLLYTGPEMDAVEALNKLNGLLRGTELVKTEPTHDFDSRQTRAILARLPNIDVSRSANQ